MTPREIATLLGDSKRGDEVLATLDEGAGPAVVEAIRKSFKKGDEQANERRLRALVKVQGEGALDVVAAVLVDTVEVGGIYSNLRNVALDLMQKGYLGHPRLATPLWRAIEIDEYLDIDTLYPVVAAYDPPRARALLWPLAARGVPNALRLLADDAEGRTKLLELLDAALAGDPARAGRFVEAMGEGARRPECVARLKAHAGALPAAAEAVMVGDASLAREVADRLASKDYRWRTAAVRALALLPAAEVFARISPLFAAPDREKPAARARLDGVLWSAVVFADPRWSAYLVGRLAREEHPKVRGLLVRALGLVRPSALDAILAAPKDDLDAGVLGELATVLSRQRGKDVIARVRAAAAAAPKGKLQRALKKALTALEYDPARASAEFEGT